MNVLGQSLFSGMHKDVNGELRKTMEELLVPSYERLNREMFKELGKVFTEGTKECNLYLFCVVDINLLTKIFY